MRVALACSGLDHVARGYETNTRDLRDALRGSTIVTATILKGSGPPATDERAIGCLRRDRAGLPGLARVVRRPSAAYEVEALTFTAPLLRALRRARPHVVYLADKPTAIAVHALRRFAGGDYRILFSNGGPYAGPFPYADFVQHLTHDARATAEARGEPPDRSEVLPYGFALPPLAPRADPAARAALELPTERPVVIAVGALDLHHKRHDRLAAALARLPEPRPYFVVLGQPTPETDTLRARLEHALGPAGFAMRTVAPADVARHLAVADVFALASVVEGFGRGYVEAAASGLPCVAHDFPVAREVLGPWGRYTDMTDEDSITETLAAALTDASHHPREEQAAWISARYGWDALLPAYEALFTRVAAVSRR